MRTLLLFLILAAAGHAPAAELSIRGTRFFLDGKPFPYTGVSFFNAIYNPTLHKSQEDRVRWLEKFRRYGVNVLRVWAQWDNKRGFVDSSPESTLYHPDGRLRMENVARLKALCADADRLGMVVELVFFSQESWRDGVRLGKEESIRAITALAAEVQPYRNVVFQVWNEFSENVLDYVKAMRAADPKRLVTSSPGVAGVLGDIAQNNALDFLTPHTTRNNQTPRPWEVGPKEIAYLLARFKKPVVDDEPSRNGTPQFGGPKDATDPMDHILEFVGVWREGGYVLYHHDMFQTGYGTPACPPHGIPDPEFSPYHRQVFEFLAKRARYQPAGWE